MPAIEELTLAGDPNRWMAAGFHVDEGRARVGRTDLRLAGTGAGRGIAEWALSGVESLELDGLPTRRVAGGARDVIAPVHPNGVVRLDHVVAFSGNLERTVAALEKAGLDFRRLREGPTPAGAVRQAFFRLGETILEVVEHPPGTAAAADPEAAAHFYGLAFLVDDLDAAANAMGAHLGRVRDAVQPGRRIATASREAGLGLPVAFMTSRPDGIRQAE